MSFWVIKINFTYKKKNDYKFKIQFKFLVGLDCWIYWSGTKESGLTWKCRVEIYKNL